MKRDWTYLAAVAALTILAVVRVASTHRVFSATLDEPIHLAASYEWLSGEYKLDVTHPPLSRMVHALPFKLAGVPAPHPSGMIDRGNQLLYHDGHYARNIARARRGNLLFLVIAIASVAAWARHRFPRGTAILAVAIFTSVPAILGHAGLATTDMAVAATLPLALLALDLRRPLFLGFAVGLGMLSKLSFLVFFPACAIVLILAGVLLRRAHAEGSSTMPTGRSFAALRMTPRLGMAVLIAALTFWAGYQFDFGRPVDQDPKAPEYFAAIAPFAQRLASVPLPAPSFALGFARVKLHDRGGHNAFLLGKTSRTGWWYYFPVVFFFKTPLPLLILIAWSIVLRDRRAAPFLLIAAAILLVAMTASLNIGLRHILPIYAPLAIAAAFAATEIWRRAYAFGRVTLVALLLWLFGGVAVEHPDYLAWFNELARPNPAAIAVDSNLDWGQDVLRLADFVRERHIEHIYIALNNATRLEAHGIPAEGLPPHQRVWGWVAVGENWMAFTNEFDWLRTYRPVRRIGKSIRVYRIIPPLTPQSPVPQK